MANEPKVYSPKELTDQLFDTSLGQVQGNHREAAQLVILFLKEALVYAVIATTANDEAARRGLLKSVGESITVLAAPPTPPQGLPTP